MNLINWAEVIGATVNISGQLTGDNIYYNVHIVRHEYKDSQLINTYYMTMSGMRIYGRDESPHVLLAINNLTDKISGTVIEFGTLQFKVPILDKCYGIRH